MKKEKIKNYGMGTFLITLLSIVCFASFFMPLVSGEYQISILDTIIGKSANGEVIVSKLGMFGIASVVTMLLPLMVTFFVSLIPFDRIKKYVLSFFLSVILMIGFLLVFYLVSSKFDGARGIGFFAGFAAILLILITALYSIMKDPAGREHKAKVWYNGLSKIILVICLPLSIAMIVLSIQMFDIIYNFPLFMSIGIFLFFAGTIIAAAVSALTVFEKYKAGFLYFLTALCWALGILFCVARAGLAELVTGIIVAAVCAVFWISLGTVSQKYF